MENLEYYDERMGFMVGQPPSKLRGANLDRVQDAMIEYLIYGGSPKDVIFRIVKTALEETK